RSWRGLQKINRRRNGVTYGAEDGVAFWEEDAGIRVLERAGFCKMGGFFDNRASIEAAASATNSSS
ncbi:hypothetical protein Tco_1388855, partial [Tanacetum coccineum]